MDPDSAERFRRADAVFDAALDHPPNERARYVDEACGSDKELRSAVRRLLQAHERSTSFLSFPAAEHAESLLDGFLRDDADRLPAPHRLGPFRIVRQVGHGGMGAVYLGERADGQFEQRVAIKLIGGGLAADSLVRRFLQERRILAGLEHPNIARLIDGGVTTDGMPWFAMEFVEGRAIQHHCAELRLSLDDRLRLFRDVCGAVEYAHQSRVIHRDLKPSNILVTGNGTVKLLDFGIARLVDPDSSTTDPTSPLTAHPLLTPEYAAPEQLRGEPATVATDVYALGVILYELLAGERPYRLAGRSAADIERVICENVPPRPSVTLRRHHGQWLRLRGDLDTIVLKAMHKEPGRRYPSVTALLDDLLRFSDGRPLVAQPETIRYRMRRYVGRRLATAMVAFGLLVPAAGVGAWLLRGGDAGVQPHIVAVLPFDHPATGDSTDYLSVSLGDAIASQLAQLRSAAVPGRRSMLGYGGAAGTLADIARELEADAVVRGSVRRSGDAVRLTLELFDARRGRQLRTRTYDATSSGTLELQRTATRDIVAALRLDRSRAERASFARLPTQNPEAWDLFLRGRAVQLRGGGSSPEGLRQAQSLYTRARERDPDFARVRAHLALSHMTAATTYDRTQERFDQARLEAEAALRIQPGDSEAHEALGQYWRAQGDPLKALVHFERALEGSPNNGALHLIRGVTLRTLGRWEEAAAGLESSMRFDRRNAAAHRQAAMTFSRMRRYDDAIRTWDRVIAIEPPGDPIPLLIRAHQFLRRDGTIDSLEAALDRTPSERDDNGAWTFTRHTIARLRRRPADALAALDVARHDISRDDWFYRPVSLMRAQALADLGQTTAAKASYETARALLQDSVNAHQDDVSIRGALGIAYAGLGRRADALREIRNALDRAPLGGRHETNTSVMGDALEVYTRLGEMDAAFALLDLMLTMPAGREISVPLLSVDPLFDPLRTDTRYDQMIQRFSRN
jgi:tetratricopeptide (TPR) repeat protein